MHTQIYTHYQRQPSKSKERAYKGPAEPPTSPVPCNLRETLILSVSVQPKGFLVTLCVCCTDEVLKGCIVLL